MNRRDLLKMPAAAAAATSVALAQPAGTQNVSAGPELLLGDSHQDQMLATLMDLIIPTSDTPGAKAAKVPEYLGKLLAAGPPAAKRRFVEGLSWLDGYAMRLHKKPFTACAAEEQLKMLESLETDLAEDVRPGHEFVGQLKGWTARIYYSTREGFEELNKGGRVPASFACGTGERA